MKNKTASTYTPGPWHATGTGYRDHSYGRTPTRTDIQIVHAPPDQRLPDIAICTVHGDRKTEWTAPTANARLIACAPELLEALKAVAAGFKNGSIKWALSRQADSDPYHKANVLMCAAIAKAEDL